MIEEIFIRNFILIEEERVVFDEGLNIITGETGAGKSIILRAINILLGDQAKTDYIGEYGSKSIIEGTFRVSSQLKEVLETFGFETKEPFVIITREMSDVMSTVSRINGRRVTVKLLKSLSAYLIDFHGQNQHQSLLDSSHHQFYLDSLNADLLKDDLDKLDVLVREYNENQQVLKELKSKTNDKDRQLDYIEFQLNEINEVAIKPGEVDTLEKEYKYLSNLEKIKKIIGGSLNRLNDDQGIFDSLETIIAEYNSIESYDEEIESLNEKNKEIYYLMEALIDGIQNYFYDIEYDPYRLEEINSRLSLVNSVLKKYGHTYEQLIIYKEDLEHQLEEYMALDDKIKELNDRNKTLVQTYHEIANRLTNKRKELADKFEKALNAEFNELNMKNAQIKVSFKTTDTLNKNGKDVIEFLISTNLGQSLNPIRDIASGGELSRIMLAIKLVTKNMELIPTLIFDEIDAGISGATANIIGTKLSKISRNQQIITITHLPQIAAFSNHHIAVNKYDDFESNQTKTQVRVLDHEDKVMEVAKLISGNQITDMAIKSAKELIEKSQ